MQKQSDMYTIGMIFRAIWPKGNAPQNIVDVVLTRPLTGLGMAQKHMAKANQDDIADLMDKLPADLDDPEGGVKIEDQGPFWLGYYHYLSAMDHAKTYGPKELERAGKALFGDRWQTDLSRDLGLSDARRIRQWMAGERPIPVGIWADVAGLLRHRQFQINAVLSGIADT